jgi:hypothetical protein
MNLATLELELELHTYLERAFALAHNAQWSNSRLLDLRTSLLAESGKNGFSEFAADVLNRCDQVADQLSAARLEVQQGFGLSETNPLLELVHAPARLVRLAVDMYASSDDEKRLVASSKYETALRLEENGMEERLDSKSKAPVLAQVMAWTDLAERLERIEPENAFSGVHGLLLASDEDLRTLEAELSVPDATDKN